MKHNTMSRRVFIGSTLAIGIGTLFWFKRRNENVKIHANEVQVLLHCAYHLFPQSKLGPGALDLNIAHYLSQVLSDKRILQEDRDYLLKGARWVEESSYEEFDKSFLNLSIPDKERLLQKVSKERWGENFIETILTYIFEALLSSPVYGSNQGEIGWKWLEHQAGFPQPKYIDEINYEV